MLEHFELRSRYNPISCLLPCTSAKLRWHVRKRYVKNMSGKSMKSPFLSLTLLLTASQLGKHPSRKVYSLLGVDGVSCSTEEEIAK